MSREIHKDDEEIDFNKVFKSIRIFFRNTLKGLLSIISFYLKKIYLFLGILIAGGILGYFIDRQIGTNDAMSQEIIIHPKYETTSYFYELIEDFQKKIGQEDFHEKIGLEKELAKNIKKISLEPVVEIQDLVDNFYVKYGNKDFLGVVEDYSEDDLKKEQFKNLYEKHRLIINFKNDIKDNNKIAHVILDFIKSNPYYKEQLNLIIEQARESVEKDEKSLVFIDNYLEKLAQNPNRSEKEVFVYASENEIPTVSSILRQKEILIGKINGKKRILELEKELFSIVKYGVITPEIIPKYKKAIFLIPIILFFLVSLGFFSMYLSKQVKQFVSEES